jgi:hypothetical protein
VAWIDMVSRAGLTQAPPKADAVERTRSIVPSS